MKTAFDSLDFPTVFRHNKCVTGRVHLRANAGGFHVFHMSSEVSSVVLHVSDPTPSRYMTCGGSLYRLPQWTPTHTIRDSPRLRICCRSGTRFHYRSAEGPAPATDMIIRLGRLTPGYFRLLQRQVAGEVQTQPQDRSINQLAMMLAIMGLSLSYYSAKQMTEKVQAQPAP
ncbi:uncharacterized protein ACB058_012618 isoform 1-T1 [Synchiropus picturatus]